MGFTRADEEGADELDLFDLLELVEKTITLVGQANVSLLHFRKHGIIYKFTKDIKKTQTLLKRHDFSKMKHHDKLFGKEFYKTLGKSAKVSKISKEISNQLGEKKKQNSKPGGGGQSKPFQKGSSSNSRGGGRKVSFTRRV